MNQQSGEFHLCFPLLKNKQKHVFGAFGKQVAAKAGSRKIYNAA
jgi:hypothetical protein